MPNNSGKKIWGRIHGLSRVFFNNDPSKIGHFHQHWKKNLAETQQFEDLVVNNFFLCYYLHIFEKKGFQLV